MTTGIYERKAKEVICPQCRQRFSTKEDTGKPCTKCQNRNYYLAHRQVKTHGAETDQRRDDSKGETTMNHITATYIGSGCFIDPDGYLSFVNRANRPAHLVEGKSYRLVMHTIPHGALYYVQGEASV